MLSVFFAITTAICGIGWLVRWLLQECAYSVLNHRINQKGDNE